MSIGPTCTDSLRISTLLRLDTSLISQSAGIRVPLPALTSPDLSREGIKESHYPISPFATSTGLRSSSRASFLLRTRASSRRFPPFGLRGKSNSGRACNGHRLPPDTDIPLVPSLDPPAAQRRSDQCLWKWWNRPRRRAAGHRKRKEGQRPTLGEWPC